MFTMNIRYMQFICLMTLGDEDFRLFVLGQLNDSGDFKGRKNFGKMALYIIF